MARIFQEHREEFLPVRDPRAQRVAAVLRKLVSRLDPALAGGDPEHLMLRAGASWTVHVIDSPQINAFIAPGGHIFVYTVGWCKLMVSKSVLRARLVSALETKIRYTAFKVCFQFQLAPLQHGGATGTRLVKSPRHTSENVFGVPALVM